MTRALCLCIYLCLDGRAVAQTAAPPPVQAVDVDEHLGGRVPLDLPLRDGEDRPVHLGEFLADGKPLVLLLAYYRCPSLCDLLLRGVINAVAGAGVTPGGGFHLLTVSFDPHDDAAAARRKQRAATTALDVALGPGRSGPWPFLVGDAASIRALTDSLGYRYGRDERGDQYAHPAVAFVLTPDGRISRYLYGVEFPARDFRLALVEAGQGRVGSLVERALLTCYRYDPSGRRYTLYLLGLVRLGAVGILVAVITLLWVLRRGDRRRRADGADPGPRP